MAKTSAAPRPITLRDLAQRPERLSGGHRLCAGCGHSIIVRQVLHATEDPVVVANATGCLEVATTIYPYTAWRTPWVHTAFENAAATLSGVEAAYRALRRGGQVQENIKFVAFGGDGGTYDIGFQSLSGAMERRHNLLYVCLNNEGYMNTGIQRSSATPRGADTTTSPVGEVQPGKPVNRKDLTEIMVAHNLPYVAQSAPHDWRDITKKAAKAFGTTGPTFLNVLSPCPRGWRADTAQTIELARLAAETCYWPLYEVEQGKYRLTYQPKKKLPLADWLKPQARFKHLFLPQNEGLLEELQKDVDQRWEALLAKCSS